MPDPHADWIAECDRALAAGEITQDQHADRVRYRPLPLTVSDHVWAAEQALIYVEFMRQRDKPQ